MEKLAGGCHCGNLSLSVQLADPPRNYVSRACDCDFCCKHGASYISDPDGRLEIGVGNERLIGRYRQGSGTAEMLVCCNCGVLVGTVYRDDEVLIGAVNVRALERNVTFGEVQSASPRLLGRDEKVGRWKALWFRDVTITAVAP